MIISGSYTYYIKIQRERYIYIYTCKCKTTEKERAEKGGLELRKRRLRKEEDYLREAQRS